MLKLLLTAESLGNGFIFDSPMTAFLSFSHSLRIAAAFALPAMRETSSCWYLWRWLTAFPCMSGFGWHKEKELGEAGAVAVKDERPRNMLGIVAKGCLELPPRVRMTARRQDATSASQIHPLVDAMRVDRHAAAATRANFAGPSRSRLSWKKDVL